MNRNGIFYTSGVWECIFMNSGGGFLQFLLPFSIESIDNDQTGPKLRLIVVIACDHF